jgi:hypothetical protein
MTALRKSCAPALLLSLVVNASTVQSQDKVGAARFYGGPVGIAAVRGTIDLADGSNPVVTLVAVARNSTAAAQAVSIGFRGTTPSRISAGPIAEANVVTLSPMVQRSGSQGGAQSVALDLVLEINSLPAADPVDNVDVRIVLPPGAAGLIRSSMPLQRESSAGRASYRLVRNGLHLTTLTLVYTTGPVSLTIDKHINPSVIDRAGPVSVMLTIRNDGSGEARDISLEDSYDPRDFAGQGPEFRVVAGRDNDRRLVWSSRVPRLAAGATTTVSYGLSSLLPVASTSLAPTTATINKQLVGVSNKIWLGPKR